MKNRAHHQCEAGKECGAWVVSREGHSIGSGPWVGMNKEWGIELGYGEMEGEGRRI